MSADTFFSAIGPYFMAELVKEDVICSYDAQDILVGSKAKQNNSSRSVIMHSIVIEN